MQTKLACTDSNIMTYSITKHTVGGILLHKATNLVFTGLLFVGDPNMGVECTFISSLLKYFELDLYVKIIYGFVENGVDPTFHYAKCGSWTFSLSRQKTTFLWLVCNHCCVTEVTRVVREIKALQILCLLLQTFALIALAKSLIC